MIRSMTGFGAAAAAADGCRVSVEARTVNHRFLNPAVKLPPPLASLEGEVRERLRRRIARGHVTVTARVERDGAPVAGIDERLAAAYTTQLRALRDRLGLAGEVDLATVLRLPDVLSGGGQGMQDGAAVDREAVLGALERALDELDAMRAAEGGRIRSYLLDRLAVVEEALDRCGARAPYRLREQHDRMRAAVAELTAAAGGAGVDPQRIAQEIAVLADRLDVSEELSRFRAHTAAFRDALAGGTPEGVGKRLGFLLQEMLREANTLGSKAADAAIAADVVLLKEELERLREQAENVE